MCSFVVLVLGFYASVLAYQVTSPSESQAWTNSGAQTLTWQRVDTDPPNFAAILIHENPSDLILSLANLVDGTKLSAVFNPPSGGWPTGNNFVIKLFQEASIVSTLYAQSSNFTIKAVIGSSMSSSSVTSLSSPVANLSSSATSASSVSQRHHRSLGPIIGGVAGGVGVIAAIVVTLSCRRNRKHARRVVELDPEPKPVLPDLNSESSAVNPQPAIPYATEPFQPAPNIDDPSSPFPSVTSASYTAPSQHLSFKELNPPLIPTSIETETCSSSAVLTQVSKPSDNTVSENQLTDEQIDFVRDLWSANVPAADIARMIERMKASQAGQGSRSTVVGVTSSVPSQEPPGYDFKDV